MHKICLSLIYNDKRSLFENLIDKDESVSIHHKNLRRLMYKMYKTHRGISPAILDDLFPLGQADQYYLRNRSKLIILSMKDCKPWL